MELIDVYRGTDRISEMVLYEDTGWVLSETGSNAYYTAVRSDVPIKDALSKAIIESKAAHAKQIKEWGSLDQYIRAHGEFGQELEIIGKRSLISFTTNPEIATRWGNESRIIIHLRVPRSKVIWQTLETSTEEEVLFINGVYAK